MRRFALIHLLIPYFETPEEAARFFQRGWFGYFFPRFPIFAAVIWFSGPALDSLWHWTPSFSLRWFDLLGHLLVSPIISFPIWLGYKHTYRDFLQGPPRDDQNA